MRNLNAPLIMKIVLPLVFLALGVMGFRYFLATKPVETPKEVVERSRNVSAMTAKPSEITSQIKVYGELVSARSVDLRSLVGGEVIQVSEQLIEGARIPEGNILLEVDPFEYEATVRERQASLIEAKSRLQELQASERSERVLLQQDREILELEKRNLSRAETLKKRGNISDKAMDDAQTALSRQQQQVEQRSAQLDIQKARIGQQRAVVQRLQVALERAERDLQNTHLIAPFGGYIQNVSVELGKKIDAKDLVATLIDDTRIEVRFHLSNAQYGALVSSQNGLIGRPLQVRWQAGSSSVDFSGVIARIGSSIQSTTGGVDVYARLEPSDKLERIRIGAFVEVSLAGISYPSAIRIPDYALFSGSEIFKIVDGRLQPITVELLENEGESLIITAPELRAGDQILTTRFAEAGPGIKVEIR